MAAIACAVVVALSTGCAILPTPSVPDTTPRPTTPNRSAYRVLGGVEQLYVLDALEGDRIDVVSQGRTVATGVADRFGSLAVRELEQGRTYQVVNRASGDTRDVRVLVETEHPPAETYRSTQMHEGLNYIPMRDGITLAATVRPPIGQSLSQGPFPTVIEYSGYQIAAPNEPLIAKVGSLLGLPNDPLAPGGETDVGSLLVRLAGYAVVSVQMRGTGCSGGEADLFDLPTRLDGYDAVETVAAQPWVRNGTVGMVGISFSGFSQIATAAMRPPHLSAIAPMSFVGSLYDIAHPGGIFNDGFARTWMAERVASARPAPAEGALAYANELVRTDARCRENQRLRLQTRDGDGLIRSEDTFGEVYQRRDFREWMRDIQVPTFASLQFEDEETSSYAILSAQDLLGANDRVWLNVSSGHHRDAVTPDTITQFFEFLDIYVAREAPGPKFLVNLLSGIIFGEGSDVPPLPTAMAWTLETAQASFEARPRVRVLLELPVGANEGRNQGADWQLSDSTFPLRDSFERTWFLGDGGTLLDAPGATSSASYRPDPAARRTDPGPALVASAPAFEWTPLAADAGLGFVSSPLTEDVVALGPAALDLRLSSSAADTDVAVVITEVRPDGQEMLVGTGVQRASMRDVDHARSSATVPAYTLAGGRPLDPGVTRVPVQVLPMGHVFRAGSRLRVLVTAVNGDRERWTFDSVVPVDRSVTDTIHLGEASPSSITFTLSPRRGYPPTALPCPAAAKPCRPYTPMLNGG